MKKFTSKRGEFNRKNNDLREMVLGNMSIDIERAIKSTAGTPVDKGHMKASAQQVRQGTGGFRVEVNKEYAAVQELGIRSGAKPFQNYTTQGTSAGWFRRAIEATWSKREGYLKMAKVALGL